MKKLYIVIPAYNEQDNIDSLIADWYPIVEGLDNSRLLIVNDGSTDDTYRLLKSLSIDRPKLEILTKANGGHGDTLLFGYRHAIENGADWIFQTDSDGQTKALEFQEFWVLRNQYDAIFGCRKKRGDGVSRKFIEIVLCALLRMFFGVKVPDANCPFRLMRSRKVAEYIERMPEHYFLPNVMLTVYFVKSKDKVLFKEVTFENRKGGKNSINIKKIVKIGLRSLGDFHKFRKGLSKLEQR